MTTIYGLAICAVALVVLVGTAWLVDRLDAADRGPKRVLWRPWYRTAIACVTCLAIGVLFGLHLEVFGLVFVAFAVLLVMQIWTRSGVALQLLECLGISLSFYVGVAIVRSLDATITRPGLVMFRAFVGSMGLFVIFGTIAVLGTHIRRRVERRRLSAD